LVPRPLDEGPRTKKWQIEAKPTSHLFLEGKSIGLDQKTVLKGELLIWRTKNQGWSELAATNAPVEDERVQPVLRMNILPARGVFFFSPLLCPTYLPPPT